MKQETIFIQNRQGFKMSVRITKPKNANKLVFLEHGFSGCKDEAHMLISENEFAQKGYIVVNIDAVDSLNKSESSPAGASFSGHYTDLEDTINWAATQEWFREPFSLSGHSMGAASVIFYAENYPERIDLLLPISFPWLSGKSKIAQEDKEKLNNWKQTGFWNKISKSRGRTLCVPYNFIEDLMKYNFAEKVNKITAKTILIIGDKENKIRLEDNNNFFNMLKCEKDFIILPNTPHCTATTHENAETFRKTLAKILK